MGEDHDQPLSQAALDVLRRVPSFEHRSGLVFPSRDRPGKPFSNAAFMNLLRRLGYADRTTAHGFRATFRTWATECTDASSRTKKLSTAHKPATTSSRRTTARWFSTLGVSSCRRGVVTSRPSFPARAFLLDSLRPRFCVPAFGSAPCQACSTCSFAPSVLSHSVGRFTPACRLPRAFARRRLSSFPSSTSMVEPIASSLAFLHALSRSASVCPFVWFSTFLIVTPIRSSFSCLLPEVLRSGPPCVPFACPVGVFLFQCLADRCSVSDTVRPALEAHLCQGFADLLFLRLICSPLTVAQDGHDSRLPPFVFDRESFRSKVPQRLDVLLRSSLEGPLVFILDPLNRVLRSVPVVPFLRCQRSRQRSPLFRAQRVDCDHQCLQARVRTRLRCRRCPGPAICPTDL